MLKIITRHYSCYTSDKLNIKSVHFVIGYANVNFRPHNCQKKKGEKQTNKQTHTQTNKQTNKQNVDSFQVPDIKY